MFKRTVRWHERQPLSRDELEVVMKEYHPLKEISPYKNPRQSEHVRVGDKIAVLLTNGLVEYSTVTALSDHSGFHIVAREESDLQHKGEKFCVDDGVNHDIFSVGYKIVDKFPWEDIRPKESVLEQALQASWCKETSSNPLWNLRNPAKGQCAVTALVVQDYHGGEIVWTEAILPTWKKVKLEYTSGTVPPDKIVSHYFNFVHTMEKDYTRQQFPRKTQMTLGIPRLQGFSSTRDYVLSNPDTVRRYELLKGLVEERLS